MRGQDRPVRRASTSLPSRRYFEGAARYFSPAAKHISVLAAVLIVLAAGAPPVEGLKLQWIPADVAALYSPACLDGSPYGFYFSPATDPSHTNDWVIYFRGGGWCFTPEDCLLRSKETLGSSKQWTATYQNKEGGAISPHKSSNPDFYGWNRVLLPYCDGASFSGDVSAPVAVTGDGEEAALVHFRGAANVRAAMYSLMRDYSLDAAQQILVYGTSAGGTALFLNVDRMREHMLPMGANVRALADSSFFLDHDTVEGKSVWPDELRSVYEMQNVSAQPACVDHFSPTNEAWRCMIGQHAYGFVNTSLFLVSSAYDLYSTQCIFLSEPSEPGQLLQGNCSSVPGYEKCASNPGKCTDAQLGEVNGFAEDFVSALGKQEKARARGSGLFIHSCYVHSATLKSGWANTFIDGVSPQKAVGQWWRSFGGASASEGDAADMHTYLDCRWHDTQPYQCDLTC
eukprot:TRINITY_DN2544_c0_g1_i1.p1 TRINITY_DN2544_c0_g1~~TRINITY_DN2544_c0_g1_i1.p1  ORF type:complete len:456 (+),score=82.22 TRINITY_DN2544_c0_g1_i1:150-1517(+)